MSSGRGKVLLFFGFSFMTSSPNNEPKLWLKVWLDSRLEYESLEPLKDFLAFLVLKLWPEDPNLMRYMLSNLRGFP